MTAQYSHQTAGNTLLGLEGGYDRNLDSSAVRGAATLNSSLGNIRGEFLHNFEGRAQTQYDLAFQSGVAIGPNAAALGAREMEQSAMIVTVGGDAHDVMFDVLLDEVVRGRVRSGGRLSLFVPSYRTYKVRLVPAAASAVSYNAAAREVTLYPGNVRALDWQTERFLTIFAQALTPEGEPIAGGLVETPRGIAETDEQGYFQVDVRQSDLIAISKDGRQVCSIRLPELHVRNDFASVGKVTCQ
jgi:outer membrane usher protein FimD/PapC